MQYLLLQSVHDALPVARSHLPRRPVARPGSIAGDNRCRARQRPMGCMDRLEGSGYISTCAFVMLKV
jgi:hypothetical protein